MKMFDSKIDFGFISTLEGSSRKGYVPDPDGSMSGVTIASGFDIGQRSRKELLVIFDESICQKLLPYVGKVKHAACEALDETPLEITECEEQIINQYAHKEAELRLRRIWNKSQPFLAFDDLSGECQTVIASVAFQYGDLSRRTPNFWRQVTMGQWSDAVKNLRNFSDKYPKRRNKEADLLVSWLTQQ